MIPLVSSCATNMSLVFDVLAAIVDPSQRGGHGFETFL